MKTINTPPYASGARRLLGHTAEFLRSPDTLLDRGAAEHGTMFSLRLPGNHVVVMAGPEHSHFVFAQPDETLSIGEAYPFFRHMFTSDAYFLASPEEYHRQRDIVLPRFQARQTARYVEVMEREASRLIDSLPAEGTMELTDVLGPLGLRVAAECFLGSGLSGRITGFFELFREFSDGMDPLLPGWVPAPHIRRSHRARDRLRRAVTELLQERRDRPLEEPDFLQELAHAHYANGEPVTDSVRVSLALMLAWVGHETTASHLCWALIDLLRHPAELDRARQEQAELFRDGDVPLTLPLVRRLEHLDRAAHESERLHPVTNGVVRKVMHPLEYAGHTLPKGSTVLLTPRLTHRLPEVFPDPDVFRPDRFLDDPKAVRHLIGFGGGLHRCLGKNVAYLEIKITVTRMLQRLELELLDPDPQPEAGQKNNWPRKPCRVRYRRRD
ncbi:cytochrome P450 [Streptomyces mirabilis]|uniref:cytochrome P450 n=1 Tax=Streptomyces mirabilis TaxID=68239 RepID=UPI0036AA6039